MRAFRLPNRKNPNRDPRNRVRLWSVAVINYADQVRDLKNRIAELEARLLHVVEHYGQLKTERDRLQARLQVEVTTNERLRIRLKSLMERIASAENLEAENRALKYALKTVVRSEESP